MVVPAVALGFGACQKKEQPKVPESAPATVETTPQAPPPAPAPVVKPAVLGADERAAKLGFAKHLPQDTEVVLAFHNGSKAVDRIQSSKLWQLVQSEMGMGMMGGAEDMEPAGEEMDEDFALPEGEQDDAAAADTPTEDAADAADEEAGPVGPAAFFGTEFTVALGKSTGEQTGNLLTLNRRSSYFQMRMLSKALVSCAKSGDFSNMEEVLAEMNGEGMIKELIADPKSGLGLFEKMSMPPLTIAFRIDDKNREAAAEQISSLIGNLASFGEEMVEPVETEKAGAKFAGQKISGVKLSASLAEDREEMDELLDAATVDKLIAAIAKKDLVILSGTLGDYVVLFVGASADDLKFAESPAQSLVAGDALAFCDPYAAKELAAVIYGRKDALDQLMATVGGLSDMAEGLRDGLSGAEGLGDTRDLEALLRMVGERESALRKLAVNDSLGIAAFFEEGLKIESVGGTDSGAVDWKSPNKLTALGASDDVAVFANMTADAVYDEKARAYAEALFETAYGIAMKVSELPVEDEKMVQFKEMAKMFDTTFRPDVVALWQAFSGDFGSGLGNESAFIIDFKGAVPTIPGVPQPVVDQAKFPRISVVAPVTDRAKLSSSWQKMNASATSILGKISEMSGQEIPMQKPISSEKDGFTTWFFSMPFFNDDFMPSVTVGDKWFAASTSKNQALDLIRTADKGGETRNGLWFSVNFNTLRKYSEETVGVLDKNKEELGIDADDLADIRKVIAATEDLDTLTVHARREGGALRSSVHFKTR